MCFSATASLTLAATTAAIGLVCLREARSPRERLLAAAPLLFAVQQGVEGMLWLRLQDGGNGATIALLSFAFLIFAKVVWPAYAPIAVLLAEPDRSRRRALGALAAIGTALSAYLLTDLLAAAPGAAIRGHSIDYGSDVAIMSWQMIPYLLCTCGALLLSSHPVIRATGAVVAAGFALAAYAYLATFVSVWCFFAAAASLLLYLHFRRVAVSTPLRDR